MGAGLPGIGIGGLFYLLAALVAPIRELVLTVRGRSSFARWRVVLTQWALATAVLASLALVYLGLSLLERSRTTTLSSFTPPPAIRGIPSLLLAPIALFGVLLATWFYALWVRRRHPEDRDTRERIIADAHRSGRNERQFVELEAAEATAAGRAA